MTLGEAVLIDGSGSQRVSSRWGDYTDMTVDPSDDCTFWYVNEYYAQSSQRAGKRGSAASGCPAARRRDRGAPRRPAVTR
jgi:hypothetical protein